MRLTALFALLLCGSVAEAAPPAAPRSEVSLSVSTVGAMSFFSVGPQRFTTEASYLLRLALPGTQLPLLVGGGVRFQPVGGAPVPLEGFARVLLEGRLGVWAPAAGHELGYSGLMDLGPVDGLDPVGVRVTERSRLSPLYTAFVVAPARFVWGRWTVSALELSAGAALVPLGSAARFQLGFLRIGGGF